MKIVHLLPALEQGGVESIVCDLVRGLGMRRWPCRGEETETVETVVVSKGGRLVGRVERAGAATLREAVLKLYGMDGFAERTLSAYREVCCA